jgi:DNA polymerase-4
MRPRCTQCGSPRLIRHRALEALYIAHVDCDAFFATVEKRDNPALRDRPVLVGGETRGVVAAACYIARTYGVHSAMPMFEAKRLCPDAVIVRPNMAKYSEAGRAVRRMMLALTPMVEPLSIDEAFLDLSGTAALHGGNAAKTLARFAIEVERDIGITVSVGLSCNKFLAKIASDLDKPRGFAVLSQSDGVALMADKPVGFIYGVGPATQKRLNQRGFRLIRDLQQANETDLMREFGTEGRRLWRLARGVDDRKVKPERETKSVSNETTLNTDLSDYKSLEQHLWRLCEKVSARMKSADFAGTTITLKLKTSDFRSRTRARTLAAPTQLAGVMFDVARDLLAHEIDGTRFRLIGIGLSNLSPGSSAEDGDLLDRRSANAERAMDSLKEKFGDEAIMRGLAFRPPRGRKDKPT